MHQPATYQLPGDFELDEGAYVMAFPDGTNNSLFGRFCGTLGYTSAESLMSIMLFNPVWMPAVDKAGNLTESLLWIPGHTFGSAGYGWEYGPLRHYPVMVIGKMPGVEEVNKQHNFVGPSGQLIREVAAEIGYHSINDWYVTNAVRFLPPYMGKTALPQMYVEYCWPLLLQELVAIKPEVVVLMGADAVKTFCGKSAMLQNIRSTVLVLQNIAGLRQRMENLTRVPELQPGSMMVCATIHPSNVLRENGLRSGFVADMTRVRDLHMKRAVHKPDIDKRDYFYVETYEELHAVVDSILAMPGDIPLAVDCETGGDDFRTGVVRSVQFSWAPRTSCVVKFLKCGGAPIQGEAERIRIIYELNRLFTDLRSKLIFHNGRYELKWLGHMGIEVSENFYFDTMLADHCLNENAEHGLESLSIRFTDMGRYDWELADWVKHNSDAATIKVRGYLDIPDHVLMPYAACDTDCTFRCYLMLAGMLAKPQNAQLKELFDTVIMPCNAPLHEIERTGVLVDRDRLVDMTHRFHERKELLTERIQQVVGVDDFNPRSAPQKAKLLFESMKLKPYKTTGKPSRMWADIPEEELSHYTPAVDLETLEAIQSDDKSRVVQLLHDFAVVDQVCKQFLTYEGGVEGGLLEYISSDGRIHTSLSQTSETGREKSSNPNMQNLPKAQEEELRRILGKDLPSIRSAFVAPPGHVIVEADYKSAEIFTLGYLANCKQLVHDAASDLHARGAVNYFGAPKWKGFDEGKKPPADWKKEHSTIRVAAKTINFGIAYQRGAKAVARAITAETDGKISPSQEEAQRFIDGFYETYPEAREYVDYCKTSVVEPGYVSNAYGRRRRFMAKPTDERGQLAAWEREAVNMPIQGTVADALNVSLFNVFQWRKLFSGRCDYRILLAVHDAVLIEVPGEQAHIVYDEVLPMCMTLMTQIPPWNPWPHDNERSEAFRLDIDREVCIRWGIPASSDELVSAGVLKDFAGRLTAH